MRKYCENSATGNNRPIETSKPPAAENSETAIAPALVAESAELISGAIQSLVHKAMQAETEQLSGSVDTMSELLREYADKRLHEQADRIDRQDQGLRSLHDTIANNTERLAEEIAKLADSRRLAEDRLRSHLAKFHFTNKAQLQEMLVAMAGERISQLSQQLDAQADQQRNLAAQMEDQRQPIQKILAYARTDLQTCQVQVAENANELETAGSKLSAQQGTIDTLQARFREVSESLNQLNRDLKYLRCQLVQRTLKARVLRWLKAIASALCRVRQLRFVR